MPGTNEGGDGRNAEEWTRSVNRSANWLSTEEAAARLGVKKETVYAYVSRGILGRRKAVDGRASTFDANEVDRLRRQRLGERRGHLDTPVTTAVTDVHDGYVAYRNTTLEELAASGAGYEKAAALLWEQPHVDHWAAPSDVYDAVRTAMAALPDRATLIDQLITATVMASAKDPFRNDRDPQSATTSIRHLVAAAIEALPLKEPTRKTTPKRDPTIAQRLWPRLSPTPTHHGSILDQALMLLADHGMASSTMAARIAASTRSGPHAWVVAGLGALNGPLHGAAGRAVHLLLQRAETSGVEDAIAEELRLNGKIPGLGHFIHRTRDPRFDIMMRSLQSSKLPKKRLTVVKSVFERTGERVAVPHNIDFALGALTYAAGMSADAGELIFATARISGWIAHGLEELDQAPLRFRPIGRYEPLRPRPAPPLA